MLHSKAMDIPANDDRREGLAFLPFPPGLQGTPQDALFLDFDGTLVEIAPHPDAIEVSPDLPQLLRALSEKLDGRLAIISGRALADLDRHLGHLDIAMAGSHGGEFRHAGSSEILSLADPLPGEIEHGLRAIAEDHGGLLVEPKPFSAAIHYRSRPEAEADVVARAGLLARSAGLALKHGKMVAELVMPGSDKGNAVRRFMEMPEFSGTRPIFVGDDVTDEDAFRIVLDHEGGGILVGPERETAALWRLPGVADVHAWLKAALA